MRFFLPRIDQASFWIGFISASVLWILLNFARPLFEQLIQKFIDSRKVSKTRTISVVEEHYCSTVHMLAQKTHLASSLFSLDEISIEPRLMAHPPRVSPDEGISNEDLVTELIPYLPSWPDLAATFKAPTLSITDALSGKSDIVLTGQPGSGKTFALAFLTSQLAKKAQKITVIDPNSIASTLPFMIHIAEIDLNLIKDQDPLDRIIDFVSGFTQISDLPRISKFVRDAFISGRALLLLDGTDELASENLSRLINFIKSFKGKYPLTQIITTGIPENLQGLVTLNFIPFTLSNWETKDHVNFLEKWGHLWPKVIEMMSWDMNTQIDPYLLTVWINSIKSSPTPLEITLLTWGCYAGDIESGNILDAIKAHILRLKPNDTPIEALEMLALQVFTSSDLTFEPRRAREWIKSFEPVEPTLSENEQENQPIVNNKKKTINFLKGNASTTPSLGLISKFAESGILISNRFNQMRFVHPIIGGYLAGNVLGTLRPEKIINLPNWSGKYLAMNYFAALGNADKIATLIMDKPDRPLERNLLIIARWLRDSQKESNWRIQIMEKLVNQLLIPNQPLGFRGQLLAALLQSGDPAIPLLFRQMLASDDPELIQLSLLGCASLKDAKSIDLIARLISHPSPNVHKTACLALVTIGTPSAIDHVASVLLHGDEEIRNTAAKTLANHSEIGHEMLREAATMDDIMVRRASTFGLGRINQLWATEILAKMQMEDNQWIVRNAASEVLENINKKSNYIPKRLPEPSECPWLIAFAGKKGVGISPNTPATEILLMALTEGSEAEKLASLDYLRAYSSPNVFALFYKLMYGDNYVLREAIFRTLFEMAARGINIPDPQQLGVSQ